jgi:hypothetical protein
MQRTDWELEVLLAEALEGVLVAELVATLVSVLVCERE